MVVDPIRAYLMAEWSKVLPLTACCLLSQPGFESQPGASEKLASDLV